MQSHAVQKYSAMSKDPPWMIAVSVSSGAILASMDTFILYVATPHLRGVFSATVSEIAWVSTGYAISSMILMLLSGALAEHFGRKRVYQVGLAVFFLGSLFCVTSETLSSLIIARVIQGIGAGILLPVEMIILRRAFPATMHGLIIGLYGASVMLGPALGPLLGGYFVDNIHWSFVFIINMPIALISMVLVQYFVPQDKQQDLKKRDSFDLIGVSLLVVGIVSLIWFLERGDRTFWFEDSTNIALCMTSLCSLAMFCAHELMCKQPIINLRILHNITFSSSVFIIFLLGGVVSGTLFLLPLYMQELLGFSAVQAGTALAPRAFVMAIAFPIVGALYNKIHPKTMIVSGILLGAYSGFLMVNFTHETGWYDLLLPQILQGIAVAMMLTPLDTLAIKSVSADIQPQASALESMLNQLGNTMGITLFAAFLTHFELRFWEILRQHADLTGTVFYKRFNGVIDFLIVDHASLHESSQKAFRLLNDRTVEQVLALSYNILFQIITVGFLLGLIIALLFRFEVKP